MTELYTEKLFVNVVIKPWEKEKKRTQPCISEYAKLGRKKQRKKNLSGEIMGIRDKARGKWVASRLPGFFFWTAYASFLWRPLENSRIRKGVFAIQEKGNAFLSLYTHSILTFCIHFILFLYLDLI